MKILLYTQYFPPENNAQANRWEYFCHYLVNHGHEVTVLTSFPSYPYTNYSLVIKDDLVFT